MHSVLNNLKGWASEVFLVDSFSQDDTIDIALSYGVNVVQRKFKDFGDQWNFALKELPISSQWTMKLDPDERLSDQLKKNLHEAMTENRSVGFSLNRRLCFMGKLLPVSQSITRVWKTGFCHFTDIMVNEHPVVHGSVKNITGTLYHHDSPNLHHWFEKQNKYTTAEATSAFFQLPLADRPSLFRSSFQRRMWIKKNFRYIPFRFLILFVYHYIWQRAFLAGYSGLAWARLRADLMRIKEYKLYEMKIKSAPYETLPSGAGNPDPRVYQYSTGE
jgi:glycosyltransferase involved in cell wall biosynthesis